MEGEYEDGEERRDWFPGVFRYRYLWESRKANMPAPIPEHGPTFSPRKSTWLNSQTSGMPFSTMRRSPDIC
jgi:hypothetical protein